MRIGNVALQHKKETHHVGPVDVVSTKWSGRVGNKQWSRSRPTRVVDAETGEQVKVRRPARIALATLAGAAAVGGLMAWIRRRR